MTKMTKAGSKILAGAKQARAFARGENVRGVVVHGPIDVVAIRKETGLSQVKFAETYGLSPGTVRDWEQKRREPDTAAIALYRVISYAPETVAKALASGPNNRT